MAHFWVKNRKTSLESIGYGGESISQPPLKDKVFSTFLDQNPPFELRSEIGVSPPTKACSAVVRDWWRRRLLSEGKGHTFESRRVCAISVQNWTRQNPPFLRL